MNVTQRKVESPVTPSTPPRPPQDSAGPVVVDAIRQAFAARLSSSPKACAVVFRGRLLAITSRPRHRMARYPVGTFVVRIADGVVLGVRARALPYHSDFPHARGTGNAHAGIWQMPRFATVESRGGWA